MNSGSSETITIDIHNSPAFDYKHIENENQLEKYTDNHFLNKLNVELEKIRDQYLYPSYPSFENNSPILMSNENSDDDDIATNIGDILEDEYPMIAESYFYAEEGSPINKRKKYKKYSFCDIQRSLNQYYDSIDKYSSELDILTTYLKGQKNIFVKARYITQAKMNLLMIPSLIGTAIITVFAPIIQSYSWSGAFISGLNTVVALAISIIHYLKLETYVTMYAQLGGQYDRMENSLDFTSNKLTFMDNEQEKNELVLLKMVEIEKKINDMKDTTTIIIPNEIKRIFPIICNVNIFSFIKRVEVYKKNLIMKFKDIKNELSYIEYKYGLNMEEKFRVRIHYLQQIKGKIKDEIMHYKNAYGCIDEIFIKEIKVADQLSLWTIWFSSINIKNDYENPVLKDYLSGIFSVD